MQKLVITTITGGLLAASSAVAGDFSQPIVPVTAPAANLGDVTVGYDSQFIFRGVNFGNDSVTAGLNINTICPLTGLDLSFAAKYHSVHEVAGFPFAGDRLDTSLFASKDLGFAKAHVGYIRYNYFNKTDDAQEIAFGLSKELYGFNTSLTYFWDVETDNNGYSELAIGKSYDLFGRAINFSAALGYLVEEGDLSHATVTASHNIAFGNATLTPYISHVWELDDLETTTFSGSEQNELIGGVSLSVQF